MVDIADDAVETRDDVNLGLLGNDLTLDLVSHGSHGILGGSNEGDSDLIQSLNKGGILGQETVTYRMRKKWMSCLFRRSIQDHNLLILVQWQTRNIPGWTAWAPVSLMALMMLGMLR